MVFSSLGYDRKLKGEMLSQSVSGTEMPHFFGMVFVRPLCQTQRTNTPVTQCTKKRKRQTNRWLQHMIKRWDIAMRHICNYVLLECMTRCSEKEI
jgi:hypothetical protein